MDDDLDNAIRDAFLLGRARTLTQDVEFAVEQLVEVALRALSPGINDPFTAIACIDRLGTAMAHLGLRTIPSPVRLDDDGRPRIVAEASTYAGIVDAAFHQNPAGLPHQCRGHPAPPRNHRPDHPPRPESRRSARRSCATPP